MAKDEAKAKASCPACGAPLASPSDERCAYCGGAIVRPASPVRITTWPVEAVGRRAYRRSWLFVAAITGVSLLMAFLSQRKVERNLQKAQQAVTAAASSSATAAQQKESLSLSTMLGAFPQSNGKPAVLFSTQGSNEHGIVLVDAATAKPMWKVGPFSSYLRNTQVKLLGDKVFVVEGTRLLAVLLHDGAVLWRSSLVADALDYADGMYGAADRLAVLLRDGTTQTFDTTTGSTVWTRKSTPPPRRLAGAGTTLIQVERTEKKRGASEDVAVVDLDSGNVRHTLHPRCSTHSIIPANEPSGSSPLLLDAQGTELYVFYGFNRFCIDRWDLKSGALAWQINRATGSEAAENGTESLPFLVDDERIVYPGSDGAVYAVDRHKGELRKAAGDADNKLVPVLMRDGQLIVSATPTWEHSECAAAKNCALWGVDIDKGTVRWRYALPADARHRTSADERFVARTAPNAIRVAIRDGDQLIVDQLDPQTGVVKGHQALSLANDMGTMTFDGDLVWLRSRAFIAVDAVTGIKRYQIE